MTDRIIYTGAAGNLTVIVPAPEELKISTIAAIQKRDVPAGVTSHIVAAADMPDSTFRNAWELKRRKISVSMDKARLIAHDQRRLEREEKFKPHDNIISKQLPGAGKAENARKKIREVDAVTQVSIDMATSITALTTIVEDL